MFDSEESVERAPGLSGAQQSRCVRTHRCFNTCRPRITGEIMPLIIGWEMGIAKDAQSLKHLEDVVRHDCVLMGGGEVAERGETRRSAIDRRRPGLLA